MYKSPQKFDFLHKLFGWLSSPITMKKREIVWTSQFKRDYRQTLKRNLDISLLYDIIRALSRGERLPKKNKDHPLTGNRISHWECYILPDWLLIYHIEDDVLILTLARTGTHSSLFGN